MAGGGSFADVALGVGNRVGRYFNLVGVLPSTFLVLFGYSLVASSAATGRPDWARAFHELTNLSFGGVGILVLLTLAVAIALHPLQFAITQFFEGYWGLSRLGEAAALARIHQHRRTFTRRAEIREAAAGHLGSVPRDEAAQLHRPEDVVHVLRRDEAGRLLAGYPEPSRILPTRLGNALRRGEDLAGLSYNLPAVVVTPYIALVAPPEHVAYLDDQRAQLDAAIRLSLISLLATALAVGFLWSDGGWLLIALGTYALAYLSYRGAVVVAREYGVAVSTLITLNRFALYDTLHLAHPESTADERTRNETLDLLLRGSDGVNLPYQPVAPEPVPVPPWWFVLARGTLKAVLQWRYRPSRRSTKVPRTPSASS